MKGKRHFNGAQAAQIRAALLERPRTKAIRSKLRDVGFYISDFGSRAPFSAADFDRLISSGRIIVNERIAAGTAPSAGPDDAGTTGARSEVSAPNSVSVDAARSQYRPREILHLMVGESAPAGGTFFYLANSILFRQTRRAFHDVFGDACGDGPAFLRFFRDQGFFLDDRCLVPVNGMPDAERLRQRDAGVGPLVERIKAANPRNVIVVMKTIVPHVLHACDLAGVTPVLTELPFPRPEHQQRFVEKLAGFLRAAH